MRLDTVITSQWRIPITARLRLVEEKKWTADDLPKASDTATDTPPRPVSLATTKAVI